MQEVSLTADEVKAAREEFKYFTYLINNSASYTEKLLVFFTNELCTELKAEYAAMSDDALKAAMEEAGLPAMLQNVAVKVKNNWWNDTDKVAWTPADFDAMQAKDLDIHVEQELKVYTYVFHYLDSTKPDAVVEYTLETTLAEFLAKLTALTADAADGDYRYVWAIEGEWADNFPKFEAATLILEKKI